MKAIIGTSQVTTTPGSGSETKRNKRLGKSQPPPQRNPQKSKVARKKYRRFRKWKVVEKELEALEAKAAKMRWELKQMKSEDRKLKAKLRKAERVNSETREAIRRTSLDDARAQLYFQAMLPILEG